MTEPLVQQTLPIMQDPAAPDAGTAGPVLTHALLRDFAKQPGCERYKNDSDRIRLLSDYAWLRNLAPGLTFNQFLLRYQGVADFNEENLKHPEDAIRHHCPRSKAQADKLAKPQWSAEEVVDILVLYADVCREADQTNADPIPLNDFLAACAPLFKTGELKPPERPAATRGPGAKRAPAAPGASVPTPADPVTGLTGSATPLRPTMAGQRIIYARPDQAGRQVKGVVEQVHVEGERSYVTFVSDEGERTEGVSILHCTVCDEATPVPPQALERKKLWVPKAQSMQADSYLALTTSMGNLPLGGTIFQWQQGFDCGLVGEITLVNGETGPYVDAQLVNPELADEACVLFDLDPRRSLYGEYRFQAPGGILVLEVCKRQ